MKEEKKRNTEIKDTMTMTEDVREFLELLQQLDTDEKRETRAYMSGLRDARLATA